MTAATRNLEGLFAMGAADGDDSEAATEPGHNPAMSFWHAGLWATARPAGCRVIRTGDGQGGRCLGGVLEVNPFRPANQALVDLIFSGEPDE